jgi:hypothetical protein
LSSLSSIEQQMAGMDEFMSMAVSFDMRRHKIAEEKMAKLSINLYSKMYLSVGTIKMNAVTAEFKGKMSSKILNRLGTLCKNKLD